MVEMGTEMLKKLERIRALSDCAVRLTAHHDLDGAQILSQKMAQELFSLPLEEALPILRALGHYLKYVSLFILGLLIPCTIQPNYKNKL